MTTLFTRRILLLGMFPSPFVIKYNAFVDQMNIVTQELKLNVADRQAMLRAARFWERLHADENWLK